MLCPQPKSTLFPYTTLFRSGIKVPLPVIVGLDMAGEIAQVGAGVADWKTGDRVLVNPLNRKKGLMGEMLDGGIDRKSTRLNSSHLGISYAVFCLKKKKKKKE